MHLPAIFRGMLTLDESSPLGSIDQADRRMMVQLQPLGDLAHGRRLASRVALDAQQQLVLARRQPSLPRGRFAEAEEAPDSVAVLRQSLVIGLIDISGGWLGRVGHRPSG